MQQFDYINSSTGAVLSRVFPDLATAVMKILFNKYEMVRNQNQDTSRPQTLVSVRSGFLPVIFAYFSIKIFRDLREQAQALHSFYVKLESQGIVSTYSEAFSKYYREVCK
jgi:hypothetical protein